MELYMWKKLSQKNRQIGHEIGKRVTTGGVKEIKRWHDVDRAGLTSSQESQDTKA
jgi:hypothetical protein